MIGKLGHYDYRPRIVCSFANTEVVGSQGVGGLIGYIDYGYVYDSYSQGNITALGAKVGGLVGWNDDGRIYNCYSTGDMNSPGSGGLIGSTTGGRVSDSFWDVNSSGLEISSGGVGKTTPEMMDPNTYITAGWDFVGEDLNGSEDIWDICEGTNYPILVWQIPLADVICPDGVDFKDYSFFAGFWMNKDCEGNNNCEGADFDLSGVVDPNDLIIFSEDWLMVF